MSKDLVCITCPLGCRLSVELGADGEIAVAGNRCPRGAVYAREEFFSPKRVVTASARAAFADISTKAADGSQDLGRSLGERSSGAIGASIRRVPVRSTAPFPKELVADLLREIYALTVGIPVKSGAILISNALGTGIDVIATRTVR